MLKNERYFRSSQKDLLQGMSNPQRWDCLISHKTAGNIGALVSQTMRDWLKILIWICIVLFSATSNGELVMRSLRITWALLDPIKYCCFDYIKEQFNNHDLFDTHSSALSLHKSIVWKHTTFHSSIESPWAILSVCDKE